MKRIMLPASFIIVFLMAFFFAGNVEVDGGVSGNLEIAPQSSSTSSRGTKKEGAKGSGFRGLSGEEYQTAWRSIPGKRLPRSERMKLQQEMLAAWAEVDFKAAAMAALGEAWDDGPSGAGIEGLLSGAFGAVIRERPFEIWDLIEAKEFGLLESALVRSTWVNALIGVDAEMILPYVGSLTSSDQRRVLQLVTHGCDNKADCLSLWSSIPAIENGNFDLGQFEERTAKLLSEDEILEVVAKGGFSGERAAVALAMKLAETPPTLERLELAQKLPEGARGEFAFEVLKQAGENNEVAKAALEQLLDAQEWQLAGTKDAAEVVRRLGSEMEPEELASWAVGLPEQTEIRNLFHRGVEPYIQKDREAAWEWIGEFQEGEWRDRAYAEFSQQSLNHFNDPVKSEEALNKITNPAFQKEAWSWRRGWENRTGFRDR
ncbi:hypothetical protein V2O64_02675 [Verrucomicrobiaceae bacterium 227]